MSSHDLIVTYKDTEDHNFPLILVIGREPSNSLPFSTTTGPYDFDSAPKCAFWNTSYAAIGSTSGVNVRGMKHLSRQANASPIAFTDASPVPIDNSDARKHNLRDSISISDIDAHVANIAKMHNILERTEIVLLSGHRSGSLKGNARRNFGYASSKLEELFDQLSIEHLSVPFMYGTNQPKIIETIKHQSSASSKIASVVEQFVRSMKLGIDDRAA